MKSFHGLLKKMTNQKNKLILENKVVSSKHELSILPVNCNEIDLVR